jgi:hypothetical protein
MLLSLALVAVAADTAAGATLGTTAFTCRNVGGGSQAFKDPHCKENTGSGNFAHISIAEGTTTEVKVTNETTNGETVPAKLRETIAGVEMELQATGVLDEGWTENRKNAGTGEHFIFGEGTTTYTGVEVKKPSGKGCKVFKDEAKTKGKEGEVRTNRLKGTSAGQEMFGKLEPAEGTAFATFFLECTVKVPAIEGTWEITGSVKCPGSGSTVLCNHEEVTTQNTLKGKGNKIGVEVSTTFSGRDPALGETTYTPLAVTTVETP